MDKISFVHKGQVITGRDIEQNGQMQGARDRERERKRERDREFQKVSPAT